MQSLGLPYSTLGVSNVALLASVVVMGNAIWLFRFGGGFPFWMYAVIPLGIIAWYARAGTTTGFQVLAFSGSLCVLSGSVAAMLLAWRNVPFASVYRIASIPFIITSLVGFSRATGAVLGRLPLTISETGAMGAVEYMVGLIVAFFNLFGYFLLSSAKAGQELEAREAEIRQHNDELVETVATKDALIAVIGHDLRAPAWSAAHYVRSHLVDFDGDLNSKREKIETLAEGLERISGLLDSLLEWALCASGRMKLESSPISAGELIAEAATDLGSVAAVKRVSIEAPTGDGIIAGDRRALATVFRNLLSNAVKYSKEGSSVRTVIEQKCEPHDGQRLTVVVEDDGVGMKPEQLAALFMPGRTILTLGTADEQGKGFGLAISKLFVEAMGGTMRVESHLGQGSRFVLDFPVSGSKE